MGAEGWAEADPAAAAAAIEASSVRRFKSWDGMAALLIGRVTRI
jgi:hypothetical protein